jgi:MarR family 2-MHQ and catechol resistance regulon transcriptional repressor
MVLNAYPDKQMPLSEIGEYLVVSRPNITGLIDNLVDDGLVKRIHHPEDRRMILAQLTPQGREFMRKFVPFHFRVVNSAMAALSKTEKRQLVALLDKLRIHLREVDIPQLEEA